MPKVRRFPISKCSNSTLSLPRSVPGGTTLFGLVSKFLKNIGNRKLFFNKPFAQLCGSSPFSVLQKEKNNQMSTRRKEGSSGLLRLDAAAEQYVVFSHFLVYDSW